MYIMILYIYYSILYQHSAMDDVHWTCDVEFPDPFLTFI